MKKISFVSVCMVLVLLFSVVSVNASAIPLKQGEKAKVIIDFERGGLVPAHYNNVASYNFLFTTEVVNNGSRAYQGEIHKAANPKCGFACEFGSMEKHKWRGDWTGATHIQFWVKNEAKQRMGFVWMDFGKDTKSRVWFKKNASDVELYSGGKWTKAAVEVKNVDGKDQGIIFIPAQFQGYVRVALNSKNFDPAPNPADFSKIHVWEMYLYGAEIKDTANIYFDDIAVITKTSNGSPKTTPKATAKPTPKPKS